MKVKVRKASTIHMMTWVVNRKQYLASRRTKGEYLTVGEINRIIDDTLGTCFNDYDNPCPGMWKRTAVEPKLPYSIHDSEPEEDQ